MIDTIVQLICISSSHCITNLRKNSSSRAIQVIVEVLPPPAARNVTHGENIMAIFTTRSVVIWFSTGTLGILATLVYIFTTRVVIHCKNKCVVSTHLMCVINFLTFYTDFHVLFYNTPKCALF